MNFQYEEGGIQYLSPTVYFQHIKTLNEAIQNIGIGLKFIFSAFFIFITYCRRK